MHHDHELVIAELCRQGLDPDSLRAEVLPRLRRAVPVDALWWALVDPATMLFTRAYREEIPERTTPYFVENEFLGDDVNKWVEVARAHDRVRTLVQATGGELSRSARYRDVLQPLGLGDELRAVLRTRGSCWGFICLHRESGTPFSDAEARFVARVAGQLAEGIRLGHVVGSLDQPSRAEPPGVILLGPEPGVIAMTASAEAWLDELGHPRSTELPLPAEIYALAASLRAQGSIEAVPRLRLKTRAGRWAVLHASRIAAGEDAVAVVVEEAAAAEVAPVIMLAYGLTQQERTLTGLICRGLSTRDVAARLHVSEHTVQDHLKSIFDKVGVRSRRELVATILKQHYLPGAKTNRPIGPTGYFAGAH
jgi:DNA-binding CsgD family transcriptional regulator